MKALGASATEPTGASSVGALRKLVTSGRVSRDARIVCMVTGHGLKDMKIYKELPTRIRHIPDFQDSHALVSILAEPRI
jgi:threonine synthase